MPMIFFSVLAVCILMILFSRPRSRRGLAPEGGSRIKNALALLLVKSGPKNLDDWRSEKNADIRVPVPEGVDEGMYNDSFVFQGADADGNFFLTRLGFRNSGKEAEVWFWGIADGDRYVNDERFLIRENDPAPNDISAGGVSYKKVGERTWNICYEGTLNGQKSKADLTWKADSAMYFSARHMNQRSTARAMAEMPWNREYFEKLRSENQVRIEQGGLLSGTVEIGDWKINLEMKGIRDHSWGKRDWNYINRYMWTMLALDEPTEICGIQAKYLAIAPADYGSTFKRIATGWVAGDDEVKPISYVTDLLHLGGDGVIPEQFEILFRSPDSRVVSAKVNRRQPEMPWMMNNRQFEVNEAWCAVDIAGTKAYGVAEFGYACDLGYNRPFESGEKE